MYKKKHTLKNHHYDIKLSKRTEVIEASIVRSVLGDHYQSAVGVLALLEGWGYGTPGNVQSSVTRDPSVSCEYTAQRTQTFHSAVQP